MNDQPTSLAERVKSVREDLRESQGKFGKRFGVRRLTVSGWETGTKPRKRLAELEQFLKEQEARSESLSYQFPLLFTQTLNFECKVSPKSVDSVHFEVHINRKAG